MKLSTDKLQGGEAYAQYEALIRAGKRVRVFVDGTEFEMVTEVDDDRGYVRQMVLRGQNLEVFFIRGAVEIKIEDAT